MLAISVTWVSHVTMSNLLMVSFSGGTYFPPVVILPSQNLMHAILHNAGALDIDYTMYVKVYAVDDVIR